MGLATLLAKVWRGTPRKHVAPPPGTPPASVVITETYAPMHVLGVSTEYGFHYHERLLERNGGSRKLLPAVHRELQAMIQAAQAAADRQQVNLRQVVLKCPNFLDERTWQSYCQAHSSDSAYGLHDLRCWFRCVFGTTVCCEIRLRNNQLTVRFSDRTGKQKCVLFLTSSSRSSAHVTSTPPDQRRHPDRQ